MSDSSEDSGDDGVGLEMTENSLRNPMKLESSGIKFERSIDEPIPPLNCDTIKDKKKCLILCHTIMTVFEVILFAVFLIIFCTVLIPVHFRPTKSFPATAYIRDRLVDEPFDTFQTVAFKDVATEEDFYDWFSNVFIPFALPASPSVAQTATYNKYEHADAENPNDYVKVETIDGILSFVEGKVQIRQQRIQNERMFSDLTGPGDLDNGGQTKLNWVSAADCDTGRPTDQYLGQCNHTRITFDEDAAPQQLFFSRFLPGGNSLNLLYYPGNGYVEDILVHSKKKQGMPFATAAANRVDSVTKRWTTYLKNNRYIDSKTRAVYIEGCLAPFYVIYNDQGPEGLRTSSDSNDYVYTDRQLQDVGLCFQFGFEFTRFGYVIPSYWLSSTVSDSSATQHYRGEVIAFCTCWLIVLFFFELLDAYKIGFDKYFQTAGKNFFAIITIVIMILLIALMANYDPGNFITPVDSSKANDISTIVKALEKAEIVCELAGWIVFLAFVRIIKYVASVQMFYQPLLTIMIAWKDIVAFVILIVLLNFGFAIYGYLIFGDKLPGFSSYRKSFATLGRGLIGDLDFDSLEGTHYFYNGVWFLVAYGFFTMYIFLTMFVTIVDNGFDTAKKRITRGQYEHHAEVLAAGVRKLSKELNIMRRKLMPKRFSSKEKKKIFVNNEKDDDDNKNAAEKDEEK